MNSHSFLDYKLSNYNTSIFVNQGKYVSELLKKYKLDNVKHASTLMASTTKLSRDLDGKPVNEKTYRGMIGSLLYLTASRLNIMFSVCLCARFQSSQRIPPYRV